MKAKERKYGFYLEDMLVSNYEMIWEIVKNDLPKNLSDLKLLIEKESENGQFKTIFKMD